MSDLTQSPGLMEFAVDAAGPVRSSVFCGNPHAESLVWRLTPVAGGRLYLKAHRRKRKFEQERTAYRAWGEFLQPTVPKLLAVRSEAPYAMLLQSLPGKPLAVSSVDDQRLVSHYEAAGAWLAKLHRVPHTDNDIPLADAIGTRLETWSVRAGPYVDADTIHWVRRRVEEALPDIGGSRCPCHRDYSPRNWLVDESGVFGVIDFEHARPDYWLLDVERLWSREWVDAAHLEEAFWGGYGRRPADDEDAILKRCAALAALSTVAWSIEHQDREFEEHGRSCLARLRRLL